MKKISGCLWLKLTVFVLCAVMIVGLFITIMVAFFTNAYGSVDGIKTAWFENIAGSYIRQAVQEYVVDDNEDAFETIADNTNMRFAVVKSKETKEEKVNTKNKDDQVYSSISTISNPDYIFMIDANNIEHYGPDNFWNALSYSNDVVNYESSTQTASIENMVYSTQTGLFYACLDNDEVYIIPKIRLYQDRGDDTISQVFTLDITYDEDGNTTNYEYKNVFSDEILDKDYNDWYRVDCYDNRENILSYEIYPEDAFDGISSVYYGEVYISDSITNDAKVLPETYELNNNFSVDIPIKSDEAEYYWIYVKMPGGELTQKGDYFNQLEAYLNIMYVVERYMNLFFIIFAIGIIACCGYLLATTGKTEKFAEIKLRLYDRIPYEVVIIITCAAVGLLTFGCYAFPKQVPVVLFIMLLDVMLCLEYLVTTFVRLHAHKFWRYTICYYIVRFIGRPIKKIYKTVMSPLKYGFSKIADNPPLFLVGCAAFGGICFLELIGFMAQSMAFLFFIKLIEFALLMTFIMQYDRIRKAAKAIANGDFSKPLDISKLLLFFKQHGNDLNNVSNGIEAAVSEKMKSERFRTELITNVSHDIKTPLTSIINYVDLLQKEDIDNANVQEYLEVLKRQSARLKKLIEDLMEASKASTGSIKVELEELDAAVMISQIAGEYQEKFQKKNLDLMIQNDVSPVLIKADGRHLWRVFDNLMNNINKYAQPGTRVYVDIIPKESGAIITFKNISECPLNISSEELMERFVRGDSSRNTEGSGLGLSIAESLMKLMNGTMKLSVDGDLFKVTLEF